LVIDDEVGIREALQDMLDPYEVLTASSGESGKALIEKDQAFDLILCDLMMPEMSGMAFHRWLKNAHSDLAERLVFVTGGAFTPKARDYLTTVDNLCIHKPFDVDELTGRVFELIEDNRKRIEKT
jgi:DNA-binding response OmpR family regulator